MASTWKTVRVFISSTFRDMHAERDHLVKVAFPALRERLEKHRDYYRLIHCASPAKCQTWFTRVFAHCE